MKSILLSALVGLCISFLANSAFSGQGEIYGKIFTTDNDVLEGHIRWDKNEASWTDVLDGLKTRKTADKKVYRSSRKERSGNEVKIFGLTIFREEGGESDWFGGDQAQSGVRFGHIKTLIPDGDDAVLLTLKSGEKVEFQNGSTDFGSGVREILIDDVKGGMTEVYWEDIDHIEFGDVNKVDPKFGKRLYGKVTTRRGDSYTGYVAWDIDEVLDTDILDGRERHRNRKIEFSKIKTIERNTSLSSMVGLKDGRDLRLDASNDIDSGNRGICISDPQLGRITISWDEFDIIEFMDPPAEMSYSDFDGGKRIKGTVFTEDGDKFSGEIRWDDDEQYTWELLNGNYEDADFDIEFGQLKSIEKFSSRTSKVVLKDGRSFRLKGSNDVDSDNRGIFVSDGNDVTEINWDDFKRLELAD